MAWGPPQPEHRRYATKTTLLHLSGAVEHFALASAATGPTSVIALFQHRDYFARRSEVYARIASTAHVTTVGYAAPAPHGVTGKSAHPWHVGFEVDSELARQWSVVVLSPQAGACISAIDLHAVVDDAATLDSGRLFSAAWSFRRADAYAETVRLRRLLALDRSEPGTRIDRVLRATELAAPPEDNHTHAALMSLSGRLDTSLDRYRVAVASGPSGVDPRTGLHSAADLDAWSAGSASGTLTVGLVLVRLHDIGPVRDRYGFRAEHSRLVAVSGVLRAACPPAGRAFRVGETEFLLVFPESDQSVVRAMSRQLDESVAALEHVWPHLPVPASIAGTTTPTRPLPLPRLRAAARSAEERRVRLLEL